MAQADIERGIARLFLAPQLLAREGTKFWRASHLRFAVANGDSDPEWAERMRAAAKAAYSAMSKS